MLEKKVNISIDNIQGYILSFCKEQLSPGWVAMVTVLRVRQE